MTIRRRNQGQQPRLVARLDHRRVARLDHRRVAGIAVLVALLAVACGPSVSSPRSGQATDSAPPTPAATPTPAAVLTPGATPTAAADAIYREIATQVSVIRQLDAPDRVEPAVIDGPTLLANLQKEFEDSNPPDEIAKSERLLKVMGLLAPDVSLAQVYLELQGSQVIGYYDPKVKELFIVSRDGVLGAIEELTYAHEFTHELQDRHFDLNSLGLDTIKDNSDRVLAILALVEGDAVSAQTAWMAANLTPAQLGEVAAKASDPAMLAVLARTPRILLETALFPYQAGAAFVAHLQAQGGYASVNAAYKKLPASTEQILHPGAPAGGLAPIPLVVPTDLAARLDPGWTVAAQDTFGELQTRVWLREGGVPGDVARIAAEGWGGDRITLLSGPAGPSAGVGEASAIPAGPSAGADAASAIVWVTVWDSDPDAAEFAAAARTAAAGMGLDAVIATSGKKVVIGIRTGPTPTNVVLRMIVDSLARG